MYQTYVDNQYRKSQILTAGRERLLVMTYDGLLRFIRQARCAMEARHLEGQHNNIVKAQAIILELLNSLDHSVNAEIASGLTRIYQYLYDRLTEANVHDKKEALLEVEALVTPLREAWVEAEMKVSGGQVAQAT